MDEPPRFITEGVLQQPAEPPRATLIKWLRLNLGLSIFFFSLLTGGIGFLVKGTLQYSDFGNRMEKLETWRKDRVDGEIDKIGPLENREANTASSVSGLLTDRHERDERRNKLHDDLGIINGKIDVHTSQLQWLGDAVRDNAAARKR